MTKREWLKRGINIYREILELKYSLSEAKRDYALYSSPSFGDKVQNSGNNPAERKVEKYISAIEDYTQQIQNKLREKYSVCKEISVAIDKIPDEKIRAVFIARYVNCKLVPVIAEEQGFDERTIYNHLKEGERFIEFHPNDNL